MVFQIRDDELGTVGKQAQTGKPVGDDIRQGKKTLVHYYLHRSSSEAERGKFKSIFGNRQASTADIRFVQNRLRKYKIIDQLQTDVEKLSLRATRLIAGLDVGSNAKSGLRDLVKFCGARHS